MMRSSSRANRWRLAMSMLLSGGSLFVGCQGHLHQAVFQGTSQFVLSLFDSASIAEALLGNDQGAANGP
ncbi:MAG: hypothetical protein AABZ12_06640 [Planctomycetota bacterium]